jgi:hypothetical protein
MKKRRFSDKQRGKRTRKRKPIMFLSLEGNNKTEKLYLKAINEDYGEKFALKFTSGRETDPANMWQALQDMIDDCLVHPMVTRPFAYVIEILKVIRRTCLLRLSKNHVKARPN